MARVHAPNEIRHPFTPLIGPYALLGFSVSLCAHEQVRRTTQRRDSNWRECHRVQSCDERCLSMRGRSRRQEPYYLGPLRRGVSPGCNVWPRSEWAEIIRFLAATTAPNTDEGEGDGGGCAGTTAKLQYPTRPSADGLICVVGFGLMLMLLSRGPGRRDPGMRGNVSVGI